MNDEIKEIKTMNGNEANKIMTDFVKPNNITEVTAISVIGGNERKAQQPNTEYWCYSCGAENPSARLGTLIQHAHTF